jgi:ribose transport system substrate-binding protein
VKALVRIGIVLFGLLSVISFSLSLTQVRRLYVQAENAGSPPPEHHFSVYLPEERDSFFSEVIAGAERAAAEAGAVISIHSIDPLRNELEMASYTGVDGTVICPYLDDDEARRQLELLTAKNIPLVLINHNVPNDQPWPFIGTNNFDVGRKMGTIVRRVGGPNLRVAVVYSDKSPGIYAERELVEMGISAALGSRMTAPIRRLKTSRNPLDAEEMIYRLFRSEPDINSIIFTDAKDTVAAAQVLIDMNLVGRVQIIGFGAEPVIREFLRKGIIAGSIVVYPERIGYQAIKSLAELRSTGYTSTTVDTGVDILDGSGL